MKWQCLFCILTGDFFWNFFDFFWNFLTLLNPHFTGFGAISPLRGGRSRFSVHFGPGDIPIALTGTRFKPILMFFAFFFMFFAFFFMFFAFFFTRRRLFLAQKSVSLGKDHFPPPGGLPQAPFFDQNFDQFFLLRLAYCRRRFFFRKNSVSMGKRPFSSAWRLAAGAFFWPKFWPFFFSSGWPIAAGAFFCVKIVFLGEKDHFPPPGGLPQAPFFAKKMTKIFPLHLAACRRRFFFQPK